MVLVEDSPALQLLERFHLAKAGYAVVAFATCEDALAHMRSKQREDALNGLATTTPYDLLVSDNNIVSPDGRITMLGEELMGIVSTEFHGMGLVLHSARERDQIGLLPPEVVFFYKSGSNHQELPGVLLEAARRANAKTIAVVDDSEVLLETETDVLTGDGWLVTALPTYEDARRELATAKASGRPYDAFAGDDHIHGRLDTGEPVTQGRDFAAEAQRDYPLMPFVLITNQQRARIGYLPPGVGFVDKSEIFDRLSPALAEAAQSITADVALKHADQPSRRGDFG